DIFSLDFLRGDPATALAEPGGIVLTQRAAAQYFSGEDPLGQTLTFDSQADLRVTGVIRDLPRNTHFDLRMLTSVATARMLYGENYMSGNDWYEFNGTVTYLSFEDQASARAVATQLGAFVARHQPPAREGPAAVENLSLALEPLAD